MLKKYYKKIDEKAFIGKPSMNEHEKKFDNFCDTIIDIDWSKILYSRITDLCGRLHRGKFLIKLILTIKKNEVKYVLFRTSIR